MGQADAQLVLSLIKTLPGSFAKPLHAFRLILLHALTTHVIVAQIILSLGVILLGRLCDTTLPLPRNSSSRPGHLDVAHAQVGLCRRMILLGGLTIPLDRLDVVRLTPRPWK